jgi:DNA-binding MarR family transcriptional regulator
MSSSSNDQEVIDFGILNELIGYRLRRAQLVFFNNFAIACNDLGISPGLFGVLVIVARNPGLTQTAIAQALGNDRSAMVAAVDKLEKMDLVERRPSQKDRRSYALYLTEHGERYYQVIEARVRQHEEEFYHLLQPGEKDWLLSILSRLSEPKSLDNRQPDL